MVIDLAQAADDDAMTETRAEPQGRTTLIDPPDRLYLQGGPATGFGMAGRLNFERARLDQVASAMMKYLWFDHAPTLMDANRWVYVTDLLNRPEFIRLGATVEDVAMVAGLIYDLGQDLAQFDMVEYSVSGPRVRCTQTTSVREGARVRPTATGLDRYGPAHASWVPELLYGCYGPAVPGFLEKGILMGSLCPDVRHRPFHHFTIGAVTDPARSEGVRDGMNHIIYVSAPELHAAGAVMYYGANGTVLTRGVQEYIHPRCITLSLIHI